MVLMMTLILITVIMGVIAAILTQNERLSRVGNNAFFQSATLRIVNDLEQQLPSLLSSITGPEQLDLMIRLPLQLETKKKDFVLTAKLASNYSHLNINRIINNDGKVDEAFMSIFMRIFVTHPIADPDTLIKLILDTIDTDIIERGIDTEITMIQPDFKNGRIADFSQFRMILEQYVKLTRDTTILSIPWEDYIGYDGDKMDFNAINAETLSLLLPNTPAEKIRALTVFRTKAFLSKEEIISVEPVLASLFDNYFFIYKADDSYDLACDVQVQENTHTEHIKFNYNLKDKKIRQVEFL